MMFKHFIYIVHLYYFACKIDYQNFKKNPRKNLIFLEFEND